MWLTFLYNFQALFFSLLISIFPENMIKISFYNFAAVKYFFPWFFFYYNWKMTTFTKVLWTNNTLVTTIKCFYCEKYYKISNLCFFSGCIKLIECLGSISSSWKTYFGSRNLGSILSGARNFSQTTNISADSLRDACGFVAWTRLNNCCITHRRAL